MSARLVDETYNGWTNRATWAVALWINNDQGWQESVYDAVRQAITDAHERREEGDLPEWSDRLAASYAGDALKNNVEELLLDEESPLSRHDVVSMLHDIGSLWRVDWIELGASFARDAQEQDA